MEENNKNIHIIELENKKIFLVGTAHVSNKSAEDVENIIEKEEPDVIGVELDKNRLKAIKESKGSKNLTIEDFFKMLMDGKLFEHIFTMILSIPQNKLAEKFNIKPGQEMIKGIELAEKKEKELLLLDRDINITIPRLIKAIPIWIMPFIGFSAIFSLLAVEFIKQSDIEKLRSGDELEKTMNQISSQFPDIKNALIDERDKIIAKNILESHGQKIVVIIGAGHIKGVKKYLNEGIDNIDFDELNKIPDLNPFSELFK